MQRFMVREVVDMDVALHGKRFIVGEFILMSTLGLGFAGLELYLGALRAHMVGYQLVTAAYVSFVTINCLTFLLLALRSERQSAPAMRSVLWLTAAAVVLLALPLVFPLVAAWQASTTGSSLVKGL